MSRLQLRRVQDWASALARPLPLGSGDALALGLNIAPNQSRCLLLLRWELVDLIVSGAHHRQHRLSFAIPMALTSTHPSSSKKRIQLLAVGMGKDSPRAAAPLHCAKDGGP